MFDTFRCFFATGNHRPRRACPAARVLGIAAIAVAAMRWVLVLGHTAMVRTAAGAGSCGHAHGRQSVSRCNGFPDGRHGRRAAVTMGLAVVAPSSARPLAAAVAPVPAEVVDVPLRYCGGGFCLEFVVDGKLFRGVLDTGSPFALVSTCAGNGCSAYCGAWGCASLRFGKPVPPGATSKSTVFYAAGRAAVSWRRGAVSLGGSDLGHLTVGVVEDVTSTSGNGGGSFFGVLPRAPTGTGLDVPSFLGQTRFRTLEVDFGLAQERLRLATALPMQQEPAEGVVPLVDLMQYGAPLEYFAGEVDSLSFGGAECRNLGRIIAVIDTGTTGLVLPQDLFEMYVSTRRSQVRRLGNRRASTVEIALKTERGAPARFALQQGPIAQYGNASFDIVTPLLVPQELGSQAAGLWKDGDTGASADVEINGSSARHFGEQPLAARATRPLSPGESFSVRLTSCADDSCEVSVGLSPIPFAGSLGELQGTCAYSSQGRMLVEGTSREGTSREEYGPRLRPGDIVTCGLTRNGEVFWRLNGGSPMGTSPYDPVSIVYPWITLAGAEIELSDLGDSSFAPPLPPSEKKPSVIFMGIGFLLGRRVRIDTVAGRMEFKSSV